MERKMKVPVKIQKVHADAKVPAYQTVGAAGCDVCSVGHWQLEPGKREAIPTGLSVEIPQGYEIQVRPRSGLALKKGVTVLNTPGTIDSDYRGEVKIILVNLSHETFKIEPGERIAQLVLAPCVQADFQLAESLSTTDRGAGGFGSTGVK